MPNEIWRRAYGHEGNCCERASHRRVDRFEAVTRSGLILGELSLLLTDKTKILQFYVAYKEIAESRHHFTSLLWFINTVDKTYATAHAERQ